VLEVEQTRKLPLTLTGVEAIESFAVRKVGIEMPSSGIRRHVDLE
jgi:hypothetical protein